MRSIINNSKKDRNSSLRCALNTAGARLTNQRAVILEIIQHSDKHLDANEIFRRAIFKSPRLSLATVYRTLNRLKELGLIEEVHFSDAHHHYETRSGREHHHLVCLDCGQVTEFRYPLSQHIKSNVSKAGDFRIIDTEIRITGYCSECQQKHVNTQSKKQN